MFTEIASILRLALGDDRIVSLLTERGEVWHLQRHNRSGEVGIRGAVVQLWRGAPDDRVQWTPPATHDADADGEAAAAAQAAETSAGGTSDAEKAALCGWLMDAAANPLHPVPPDAWRALNSTSPVAALAIEALEMTERVGFYNGAVEILAGLREQALPLWTINWGTGVTEHDWAVFQWIFGSGATWRNLRRVLPPLAALTHLMQQRPNPEGVESTLRTLRMLHDDRALSAAALSEHADALDGAGVSHGLRTGVISEAPLSNADPEVDAGEVVIELGEEGIVWRVGDPKGLPDRVLIELRFGSYRDLVPPPLQRTAEVVLLARQAREAGLFALYWRLHGMPIDTAVLLADPTLSAQWEEVLPWAESARVGRRGVPEWTEGLLTLAASHVAATCPLGPTAVDRLWRLVAQSDPAVLHDVRSRLFGLCRNPRALLAGVGYTLERLPTRTLSVRHRQAPYLRTISTPSNSMEPTQDPTAERMEARHG